MAILKFPLSNEVKGQEFIIKSISIGLFFYEDFSSLSSKVFGLKLGKNVMNCSKRTII